MKGNVIFNVQCDLIVSKWLVFMLQFLTQMYSTLIIVILHSNATYLEANVLHVYVVFFL